MSSVSPPHDATETIKTINVKDVSDISAQNINPLTKEDLKKILDQFTLQAKLCNNHVLISVDKLQKSMTDVARGKVNPQEPPSIIPLVTNIQPLIQMLEATSIKVDTIENKQ